MKFIYTLLFILMTQTSYAQDRNQAIQWEMKDSDGVSHNFPESEKNKTTIVLFWATWCPYCKRLMPHLQSMLYQYGEELNLQVFALSINEDGDPNEVIEENGYHFLLFKDADEVAKKYQIKGTPGVLIFDKNGELTFDLRTVPSPKNSDLNDNPHWQKASKLAPYWASELRKALADLK